MFFPAFYGNSLHYMFALVAWYILKQFYFIYIYSRCLDFYFLEST